ncbi:hypothetical protein JCM11491_003900 [Sporobolomyces phaffii]
MSSPALSDKRLYVGNLSASVDEYSLMQVCAKYGKISKLDYLFHKTGPQKGKPRGYAFVEFATPAEADRARTTLNDKVLRGRKLVVSLASEQDPKEQQHSIGAFGGKKRGGGATSSEVNRPTAISLLKGQGVAHVPTNRKIAALEAKLALMKQKKQQQQPPASASTASTASTAPGGGAGAEAWLNDLGLTPSTSTSTSSSSATTPTTTTGRDPPTNAGLPARPLFETSEPPREL